MKAKTIFVKSLTSYESLHDLNAHFSNIKEKYVYFVIQHYCKLLLK